MALYLLYETSSGYSLFQANGIDEIGQNTEAVRNSVSDLNRFGKVVQLTAFHPFESALDALNQINSVSEGIAFFRPVCLYMSMLIDFLEVVGFCRLFYLK
jgi:nucleolar protein 56